MKMLELEIQNVRGIRYLSLKPDGKNFVVWGPNGSGKSAVVDALDFLLTGRISRLMGKGTGGITLSKHGPHIDHKPEDATVRAVIQLPGVKEPVEIKRCIAHPNKLECSKPISQIETVMTLARRGQHVLTRREILKYITAEAGTRAQEIQELLNVTEIEEIRKAFVRVQNELEKELQAAERAVNTTKGTINATVQEKTFSESLVLQVVNQNRAILGGQPILTLRSSELKTALKPPTVVSGDKTINITLLERDIQNLVNVTSAQNRAQIAQSDKELRNLISTIRSDPLLLRSLTRVELIKMGLGLIDNTGSCPLCDTPWPRGELRDRLEQRLSTAQVASQYQERISSLSKIIMDSVNATAESVQKVIAAAQIAGLTEDIAVLQGWLKNLLNLLDSLSVPTEKYPDTRFDLSQVQQMLAPNNVSQTLNHTHSMIKAKYPEATPEQTAWDTLTRLEENLKAFENAQNDLAKAELFYKRAFVLLESFQKSRDAILGKLYEDVKERFVNLYRQLHELDESKFTAKIEPEGAGLNLEVDFYGRGTHPPHALHSEGHQDSMGLCLYLALAERLTEGLINLTILDDVVMSVDADHRRELCRLLAANFPDQQFLITTHDKTWANQLKSEGVVHSRGTIEFYNWHVDTGPQVNNEVGIWERLDADIEKKDVSGAAARLRRGSEEFFGMVCDALEAPVTYKLNARWELGDFLPAAMERYRNLLKQAKKSAQSWGDKEHFDALQELDSIVGQIYSRSQAEQWAVNANVHYNNWADFSEKDFRPVVEAFQDLFGLFLCSNCGGMLRLTKMGITPVGIRCNCGKVDWNLTEKEKS